jgi:hypothetical protein
MSVQIGQAFVVKGDNVHGKVIITEFTEAMGKTFIPLVKQNHATERLLGFRSGKSRPLAATNIIETVIQLRNELYANFCKPIVADTLDIDIPVSKKKPVLKPRADMPLYAPVDAPTIDDIEGIAINVLMGGPKTKLYVELDDEVLSYLQKVAQVQAATGDIRRSRPGATGDRPSPSGKGVSFCYKGRQRNCYRVRWKEQTAGCARAKVKSKFFRTQKANGETFEATEILETAMQFQASHMRQTTLFETMS